MCAPPVTGYTPGLIAWLDGVTDPYAAQEKLDEAIASAGADRVGADVLAALDDPATPAELRSAALATVFALADAVTSDPLAVDLVVHLGACETEPPEAALAALGRAVARCPDHPRLFDAVRAAAWRSRQPRYDARHGRDFLERGIRQGTVDRGLLERFDDAIDHPSPPAAADPLWAQIRAASEPSEHEALFATPGIEPVAAVIIERAEELREDAPEGQRVRLLIEALRSRLPPSDTRGQLAAIQTRLAMPDFHIAFGCAVAALGDLPRNQAVLELVEEGFTSSPDVIDDDTVERLAKQHGLGAPVKKRLLQAIAKGRKASG